MKGIIWGLTVVFLAVSSHTSALECPSAPVQVTRDTTAEVRAAVARIGPVSGPELEVRAQNVTHDLLGKLPAGDKVYLEQMLFAAYCTALRDDRSMSEREKGDRLLQYRQTVQSVIRQQPANPSPASQPVDSQSSQPVAPRARSDVFAWEVCNTSSDSPTLAFITRSSANSSDYKLWGWYRLLPSECRTFNLVQGNFYWYANGNTLVWSASSGLTICTRQERMEGLSLETPPCRPGERERTFRTENRQSAYRTVLSRETANAFIIPTNRLSR
ncbi:hypothetical protein A9R05_40155 (plasmid) [Burkholderia sp. KK1]|nr:hypothetical protein A9R05_40155 [Burkholderia sp. KK1]